jgi:hypothetical protein
VKSIENLQLTFSEFSDSFSNSDYREYNDSMFLDVMTKEAAMA